LQNNNEAVLGFFLLAKIILSWPMRTFISFLRSFTRPLSGAVKLLYVDTKTKLGVCCGASGISTGAGVRGGLTSPRMSFLFKDIALALAISSSSLL
jgi:hypothetical protein